MSLPREAYFKLSVIAEYNQALTQLIFLGLMGRYNTPHLVLPQPCPYAETLGNSVWFKFRAVGGPLSDVQALQCYDQFCDLVTRALVEIHRFGRVHLDVRVPNIGFERKDSSLIAVFIDPDRSCDIDANKSLRSVFALHQGSMMFHEGFLELPSSVGAWRPLANWTAPRQDFRQLGLALAKLVNPNVTSKYTVSEICSSVDSDPFIMTLLCYGEARLDLLRSRGTNQILNFVNIPVPD